MGALKVEAGIRFGSLVVLSRFTTPRRTKGTRFMAKCKCDCGAGIDVESHNLVKGNTTKCTECAKKTRAEKKKTHGGSVSRKNIEPEKYRTYTIWQAMKRRCYLETDKNYHRYGGRGIKVCDRWLDSFESFLEDMGIPDDIGLQIDRINNDGNYEPSNCRWATRFEQARNKSNSRIVEHNGKSLTISQWEEITGVKRETIAQRLSYGHSPAIALGYEPMPKNEYHTPFGVFYSLTEASKKTGIAISTIHGRVKSDTKPDWYIVSL